MWLSFGEQGVNIERLYGRVILSAAPEPSPSACHNLFSCCWGGLEFFSFVQRFLATSCGKALPISTKKSLYWLYVLNSPQQGFSAVRSAPLLKLNKTIPLISWTCPAHGNLTDAPQKNMWLASCFFDSNLPCIWHLQWFLEFIKAISYCANLFHTRRDLQIRAICRNRAIY